MSAGALEVINGGGAQRGWQALWPRNEWHQRELPHGGLAGLPWTAVIHFAEMPRVTLRPPKGLDKHVFDQLIDPRSLALLGSEQHRTLILLLAHTGLRVSSLVLLRRDALQHGSDGHP